MAPPRRRDARSKQSFFRRHRFFLGVVVATHNVAGGRIKSRSAVAKAPVTRPRGQELEASEQRKKVKLMPSTRNSRENEENETGQEGHDEQIKSKQEEAVEADDDNNPRANDEDKSVEEDGDEAIPSSLDEQENNKNNMNKEGRHHQANEDKRGATEDDGRKSAASRASTAEFKNKIPMSSFSRQAKTGSSSSATGRVGIRGHHHAVDKEIDAVEEDERKVGRDEDDIDEDDQDQREESRRGRRSRTKSSVRHEELQVQGDGDQDEDSEDTTKRGSSKYQVGMLNVDEEQNIDSLEQGDKNEQEAEEQDEEEQKEGEQEDEEKDAETLVWRHSMESDQISKLRSGIETTLRSGMDMVQKRLSSGSSTSKTASVLAKRATNTTVDMSKQCGITENGGISVKANGCCPALTMRGGDRTVDQCPWHCAFAEETGPAGSDTASCSCKHCCGDPAVVDDECATVSGCATAIGRAANDTSGLKIVDRGAACKQCVGGDKYCHTNGCEGLIVLPSTDNGFVRGQYEQCVSSDASIRTGSISVWIASSLALLCSLYIF